MLEGSTQQSPVSRNALLALFGILAAVSGVAIALLVVEFDSTLVALVLVFGLYAAIATLVRPEFGLMALIFMLYVRMSDVAVAQGAPSIARPYIVLLFATLLFHWVMYGREPKGWQRAALIIAAFAAVNFASLLFASDLVAAEQATIEFLKDGVITILIVALLQHAVAYQYALWGITLAGLFMGALSTYQYLTGSYDNEFFGFSQAAFMHLVGETSGNRISGPFGSPNAFAQVLVVIIPVAYDRFVQEKQRWLRYVALASMVLTIATVVFTFSRSGFLAMAVVLGLMYLWKRPPVHWMALIGIVGIAVLPFLPQEYTDRLWTLADPITGGSIEIEGEISYRGRASEYIAGWRMFRDNPFFGVGVGNYKSNYLEYSQEIGLDPRREERSAHSLYLEIAAEQGLTGILVMTVALIATYTGLLRGRQTSLLIGRKDIAHIATALLIGLTGYMTAAIFVHGSYSRHFWVLLGICLSITVVVDNARKEKLAADRRRLEYEDE